MKILFSLCAILISFQFYGITFVEQHNDQFSLYTTALKQIYEVVGKNHNITIEAMEDNSLICQSQDTYKLQHPDVVLQDVYCYQKYLNTMGKMYKKYCFFISHHNGSDLKDASLKTSIEHKFISKEYRQQYMATRCIFTINLALHLGYIASKSLIHKRQKEFEDNMITRNASMQCLQDLRFLPISYALTDEQECKHVLHLLYKKFSQQADYPNYILKNNDHQGFGLKYIDDQLYAQLVKSYKFGELCGTQPDVQIVQELTEKPTLLRGHKMDIRIWVLVVQADPLIMYVYDYNVLMACLEAYNPKNLTQYNFNCNAGLAKDYWTNKKKGAIAPFTLQEVHSGQTFYQWGLYFQQLGLVQSDVWWSTHLLPLFEKKITYFMKIMLRKVNSDQRLSGIFALDAALDHDLNLKIFDFNPAPELFSKTQGMTFVQNKLHVDTFKLLKMYLNQRYVKLIAYIKKVMIPNALKQIPTNLTELQEVLRVEPIEQKKLFRFHLINQKKALENCEPYFQDL